MIAYVLLGGPNFGKGMASSVLKDKGHAHVDSGDYMRNRLKKDESFQGKHGDVINKGFFIPDDAVNECFEDMFKIHKVTHQSKIVMDGLFRTGPQFHYGLQVLSKFGLKPVFIELHHVSRELAWERAKERAQKQGRMDDLDEEVFLRRFGLYHVHYADVFAQIRKREMCFHKIRADQKLEDVRADVRQIFNRYDPVASVRREFEPEAVQPDKGCGC